MTIRTVPSPSDFAVGKNPPRLAKVFTVEGFTVSTGAVLSPDGNIVIGEGKYTASLPVANARGDHYIDTVAVAGKRALSVESSPDDTGDASALVVLRPAPSRGNGTRINTQGHRLLAKADVLADNGQSTQHMVVLLPQGRSVIVERGGRFKVGFDGQTVTVKKIASKSGSKAKQRPRR